MEVKKTARWQRWWWKRRKPSTEAEAMHRIRCLMLDLGHDWSDLSDEQIQRGVRSLGQAAAQSGVTAREAGQRLSAACKAMKAAEPIRLRGGGIVSRDGLPTKLSPGEHIVRPTDRL